MKKYLLFIVIVSTLLSCSQNEEKKIKSIIETSSGSETRFITEYDNNSNLVHWEYDYDLYGPDDEIKKYHYENNNLMKMEHFFRNGSNTRLSMTDYYTYNEDNSINSKISKDDEDKLYWRFEYKYQNENNQKKQIINQYDNSGKFIQERITIFDDKEREIQVPSEYQGTVSGAMRYEYLENNKVKITYLTFDNEIEREEINIIDENGYFLSGNTDNQSFEYKYDKYGNWVEKKVEGLYESGTFTEYRKIEYY
jgi:hypothetical protein